MTPLPAGKALDAFFLEARSKILDVAAILDRIERGQERSRHCRRPPPQTHRPGRGDSASPAAAIGPSAC